MKKRMLTCLMLVVATMMALLQCNPVRAEQIWLHVPWGRSRLPNPYVNLTAFSMDSGDSCKLGDAERWVEQETGKFFLKARRGSAWAWAKTITFRANSTESGSVHSDLDLTYTLRYRGSIYVALIVKDWNYDGHWRVEWTDNDKGGPKSRTVDLGVTETTRMTGSGTTSNFKWYKDHDYYVQLYCKVTSNSDEFSEVDYHYSRMEHIVLDAYTTDDAWIEYTGPELSVSPPTLDKDVNWPTPGPINMTFLGSGWDSNTDVDITIDGEQVGQITSNSTGSLNCTILNVSHDWTVGTHIVNANATTGTKNAAYPLYRMELTQPNGEMIGQSDITGPAAVPDGRVNILDIVAIARKYGYYDPNMVPNEIPSTSAGSLQYRSLPSELAHRLGNYTIVTIISVAITASVHLHKRPKRKEKI